VTHEDKFTNKEMLQMLLRNQEQMDAKLDLMKEELNGKVGKMEIMGWLLALSAVLMIVTNWQALV
jgi:hypothetical protein